MSYGLLICSKCSREVHQDGDNHTWRHCEDKSPICEGARRDYPRNASEIKGKFCGCDDFDGVFVQRRSLQGRARKF